MLRMIICACLLLTVLAALLTAIFSVSFRIQIEDLLYDVASFILRNRGS